MTVFPNHNNKPLHRQIAERIKGLVSRNYVPGDILPSYLELAKQFSVGLLTVKRAMDILTAKGIVTPIRRKGTVVNRAVRPGEIKLSHVGLVIQSPLSYVFNSRYLSEILSAVCKGVDHCDADLRIFSLRRSAGAVPPQEVVASGLDGVILLGAQNAEYVQEFAEQDIPLVMLDHQVPDLALDYVVCNNADACTAVVDHLVALGHRRIAYIDTHPPAPTGAALAESTGSPSEQADRIERREGFVAAMDAALPDHPAPVHTFIATVDELNKGDVLDEVTTALRSGADAPTAAVAYDEDLAVRLITHMADRGIHVPKDFSVAAVAGADLTAPDVPPLTYCQCNFTEMGLRGMETLDLRIRTPRPDGPNVIRVGFNFRLGKTSAPPPRTQG